MLTFAAVWPVNSGTIISASLECSIERNGDSGVLKNKAGYRNSIMLSFQTNPEYGHSILMALCVSGDS